MNAHLLISNFCYRCICLLCLFLLSHFSLAQKIDSLTQSEEMHQKNKKVKKEDGIMWIPVLASNPANGFMYGLAPSRNWKTSQEEGTSYSNVLSSIVFTTKSQFLFTLKGTVYQAQNKSLFMADVRYFQTSQPTFGLGTGDYSTKLANSGFEYEDGNYSAGIDEGQLMKFNFIRVYGTYFKKMKSKGLYAGLGYHLDVHYKIEDQLLKLDSIPPVITSHYAYAKELGFDDEKYTLSGVSANLLYDTRDNTVSPYSGMYGLVTLKYNPEWLGSAKTSGTLWAEFRKYFNVKKDRPRNIIALWAYGNYKLGGGKIPYLDLPALGWDQFGRSGRAYPQGRFRGEQLMYSELEWRFPLQKNKEKWGGVLFVNATTASNKYADIDLFKYINTGYGLGLRFALNEKSRTNLCLDYGFGNNGAQGFYLSVNEVF